MPKYLRRFQLCSSQAVKHQTGLCDHGGKPRVCEWLAKWLINVPVDVTAVSQHGACLVC